jgi:hypothetical protein
MNMYTKLSMHLSRHMYKRGKNKGDAPANAHRRAMDHFRVVKGNDDTYRVRMFQTDILTAYPNGDVKIDTNGYHTHNTTIIRLNEAFSFMPDLMYVNLRKQSVYSYSQPVLRVNDKLFSYYDGITLNAQCEVITPLQAFEQKRVDKAATKELANDLQESGFADAFKLLYAVATPDDMEKDNYGMFGVRLPDALSDSTRADTWKMVIARSKFQREYAYPQYQYVEKSNAKACWATIMAQCKKNMYIVSRSETFVL